MTDAEFSPSDLAKKIARPKTGEFMLLNKEGDVHFIKERWLLTYHCTMSPEQLRRYKAKGLAPYEGSLNTDIAFEDFEETIKSDEQEEIQSLWNDAKDAIGQACNLLEKILDHDINSEKARLWISILRDPDGFNRRLQEAQRQLAEYAESAPSPKAGKGHEPSGLMTLLSEKKSASQGPSFNDTRPVTSPASTPPPGDSILVEDDGSVTYKGRTFQLYRRYAGKSVAFIEEDGELKFSIEGKVLSKSFKL